MTLAEDKIVLEEARRYYYGGFGNLVVAIGADVRVYSTLSAKDKAKVDLNSLRDVWYLRQVYSQIPIDKLNSPLFDNFKKIDNLLEILEAQVYNFIISPDDGKQIFETTKNIILFGEKYRFDVGELYKNILDIPIIVYHGEHYLRDVYLDL
jgi:hypothetical protein